MEFRHFKEWLEAEFKAKGIFPADHFPDELVDTVVKQVHGMLDTDALRVGQDILGGRRHFKGKNSPIQAGIFRLEKIFDGDLLEHKVMVRKENGFISGDKLWAALLQSETRLEKLPKTKRKVIEGGFASPHRGSGGKK